VALVYSTSSVHPRDRVAYWREEVIPKLPRHGFDSSVGTSFTGEVRFHPIAGICLQEFDCNPCELARTRADISRCAKNSSFLESP
jgi:hypothetical protein